MAQIGSFVPASFASVPMVDKLFTRIGTSDSIETNSSSFMVEMQETAHIVNHATDRCGALSSILLFLFLNFSMSKNKAAATFMSSLLCVSQDVTLCAAIYLMSA